MTAANANSHKSPATADALIVERTFNAPRAGMEGIYRT